MQDACPQSDRLPRRYLMPIFAPARFSLPTA